VKILQSLREVIEKGPYAHLTTLNQNGSPQVTVVWVGIEGEEFVIGHLAEHQKVKNIRRDPRVALSLVSDKTSAQGMREYVVAYGNARITEGSAVFPPPSMLNIPGFITRVAPDRFTGVGPWAAKSAE
jgi:PPOX class probable F420-dependent enzyme